MDPLKAYTDKHKRRQPDLPSLLSPGVGQASLRQIEAAKNKSPVKNSRNSKPQVPAPTHTARRPLAEEDEDRWESMLPMAAVPAPSLATALELSNEMFGKPKHPPRFCIPNHQISMCTRDQSLISLTTVIAFPHDTAYSPAQPAPAPRSPPPKTTPAPPTAAAKSAPSPMPPPHPTPRPTGGAQKQMLQRPLEHTQTNPAPAKMEPRVTDSVHQTHAPPKPHDDIGSSAQLEVEDFWLADPDQPGSIITFQNHYLATVLQLDGNHLHLTQGHQLGFMWPLDHIKDFVYFHAAKLEGVQVPSLFAIRGRPDNTQWLAAHKSTNWDKHYMVIKFNQDTTQASLETFVTMVVASRTERRASRFQFNTKLMTNYSEVLPYFKNPDQLKRVSKPPMLIPPKTSVRIPVKKAATVVPAPTPRGKGSKKASPTDDIAIEVDDEEPDAPKAIALLDKSTPATDTLSADNTTSADLTDQTVLVYPSKADYDAVTIVEGDMPRLQPDECLDDSLIDFWLMRIQKSLPNKNIKVHIFNTIFFTTKIRPGSTSLFRALRWTRKLNLFDFDFIIIPVNLTHHWRACVICNPKNVFIADLVPPEQKPAMIVFDSLASCPDNVPDQVRDWLNIEAFFRRQLFPTPPNDGPAKPTGKSARMSPAEAHDVVEILFKEELEKAGHRTPRNVKMQDDELFHKHWRKYINKMQPKPFTKATLPSYVPIAPEQKNFTDCGVYVLEFVEQFLKNPPPSPADEVQTGNHFSTHLRITPEIIVHTRLKIRDEIYNLAQFSEERIKQVETRHNIKSRAEIEEIAKLKAKEEAEEKKDGVITLETSSPASGSSRPKRAAAAASRKSNYIALAGSDDEDGSYEEGTPKRKLRSRTRAFGKQQGPDTPIDVDSQPILAQSSVLPKVIATRSKNLGPRDMSMPASYPQPPHPSTNVQRDDLDEVVLMDGVTSENPTQASGSQDMFASQEAARDVSPGAVVVVGSPPVPETQSDRQLHESAQIEIEDHEGQLNAQTILDMTGDNEDSVTFRGQKRSLNEPALEPAPKRPKREEAQPVFFRDDDTQPFKLEMSPQQQMVDGNRSLLNATPESLEEMRHFVSKPSAAVAELIDPIEQDQEENFHKKVGQLQSKPIVKRTASKRGRALPRDTDQHKLQFDTSRN